MKSIGKITKEQLLKAGKKASREIEYESVIGWKSITKVHKSNKTYTRKTKHK